MPPPESKLELTESEILLFERWISEGALYEEHWSFRKPKRAQAPELANPGWALDPLDRFVGAGVEAAGLSPAEEADRATWLRRVTFDLTGLPPSLEELDRFLSAAGADAYSQEVDRLEAALDRAPQSS